MKKLLSTKVKDMNAITLIALVITIVVLIILAAVAINLSLGNNGIFNRAKTGKELYQNAEEYEKKEALDGYSNSIDSLLLGQRDSSTYKVQSLINTNDTLYNSTYNGFVFDTPSTYTNLTSNNLYINLNDNMSNYDYLIFDFDTYYNSTFTWGRSTVVSTKFSGAYLEIRFNSNSNYNYIWLYFDADNRIKAASAQTTSSNMTKIRIVDIKGVKF